jgi:hypothetical protein
MVASAIFDGPAVMLDSLVNIDLTTICRWSIWPLSPPLLATVFGDHLAAMKPGVWRRSLCWFRWLVLPVPRYCWGETQCVAAAWRGADYGRAVYQRVWLALASGDAGES